MPLAPDTPHATKDPATLIREILREAFTSAKNAGRIERPASIDLRADVEDLRAEAGDHVTFYMPAPTARERVGTRHWKVTAPVKVDIRSVSRARAYELLDAVVEALDHHAVHPMPGGDDWHELVVGDSTEVSSYAGRPGGQGSYTHLVLDVTLVNHLRPRRTPRYLGGTSR